eukprot:maker-scaffold1095_size63103-snap-gene-0.8 protein:Tk02738 transcript:maker-scaffold1095_size63103-snap-gene-0.8-mRNA-1 annotation:"cryptochrome precursor"
MPSPPELPVTILWFRHGLRIHDNPSLHAAIEDVQVNGSVLMPLFIFDGESAGTKLCGINRFTFLLECLQDLNRQFQSAGSQLNVCRGSPQDIFAEIHNQRQISKLCFEQDCEPIWKTRDEGAKACPPLTFSMFNHVVSAMAKPIRPLDPPDLSTVSYASLNDDLAAKIGLFPEFPSIQEFNLEPESETSRLYIGGESIALGALEVRLEHESKAFARKSFLPNQRNPDILCPPKSLSPDLRFGSLSVRKFYWGILDAFKATQKKSNKPFNPQIVSQLVWREFFYTMSVNNEYYDEMERNEICISIPWYPTVNNPHWKAFTESKTGYPFIDAGMRQLYKEGWIHHVVRNAIACFLTRGDLWISWVDGLRVFLKYLLDADWSVCAGNWMWISSSAFEQVLTCSVCIHPSQYGRRFDPWGKYIQRYLPELAEYPVEYIYEPWDAPIEVQEKAGCVIGKDYPHPIVDHEFVSEKNAQMMNDLKQTLIQKLNQVSCFTIA